MKKSELIEELIEHGENKEELKKMTKDELEELYEEITDSSDLFPNGRDYDAETWD